jgi:transcriptional regulator with PAS, ATPase and Fis domain
MLFLDEISNISPLIQKKLLRFLQEREFERVGEIKTRQVDIQVVAASNQNLWQMVERGEFREDLYWRLKVFEIHLSPLRERIADLPLLFTHFMTKINQRLQRQIYDMTNECWTIFRGYHWPGNIRELLSVCEYAAVLCKKNQISVEHLPRELQAVVLNNYRPNTPKHTAKIQITDLRNALEKCHGKRQATADLLGISRQTLYRKMKEHNIS